VIGLVGAILLLTSVLPERRATKVDITMLRRSEEGAQLKLTGRKFPG
jgi:hypothetical protein